MMRSKRTLSAAPKVRSIAAPGTSSRPPPRRAHVLDVPFAMRAVATASGARWEAERNVFVFRGETLPGAEPFRPAATLGGPRPARARRRRRCPRAPPRRRRTHRRTRRPAAVGAALSAAPGVSRRRRGLGRPSPRGRDPPDGVRTHGPRRVPRRGGPGGAPSSDGRRRQDVVLLNYTVETLRGQRRGEDPHQKGPPEPAAPVVRRRCWDETAAKPGVGGRLAASSYERGSGLWLSRAARTYRASYLAPLLANHGSSRPDLRDFEGWCRSRGSAPAARTGAGGGATRALRQVRGALVRRPGAPPAGCGARGIAGWRSSGSSRPSSSTAKRALYAQAWTSPPRARSRPVAGIPSRRSRRPPPAPKLLIRAGPWAASSCLRTVTGGHRWPSWRRSSPDAPGGQGPAPWCTRRLRRARSRAPPLSARERGRLFTVEEGISLHQMANTATPHAGIHPRFRWPAIQMAQIEAAAIATALAQVYWVTPTTIEDRSRIVARRIRREGVVGDDVDNSARDRAALAMNVRCLARRSSILV